MIKATGLAFDEDRFAGTPGLYRVKECREHLGLDRHRAKWTGNEVAGVNPGFGQRQVTFGACDRNRGHSRLSHTDDARVGYMIVQRAFLAIKCSYDVSDIANNPAHDLR